MGNAVQRNTARRRLRAMVLSFEKRIQTGQYIFVAKQDIAKKSHAELKKDFNFAFKRLNLFK